MSPTEKAQRRAVLACWLAAIAAVVCAAVLSVGVAHADPDPVVCGASRIGLSPTQIVDGLHRGDPRLPVTRLPYQVFRDLQDCP